MINGLLSGNLRGIFLVTAAFAPAEIATATVADRDVSIPGLLATDVIAGIQSPVALAAGLSIVGLRVKENGVATVRIHNTTGGALTPAAGDYKFVVVRGEQLIRSV